MKQSEKSKARNFEIHAEYEEELKIIAKDTKKIENESNMSFNHLRHIESKLKEISHSLNFENNKLVQNPYLYTPNLHRKVSH